MPARACELLEAWLDGALAERERLAFAEHLPDCGACGLRIEEEERLHQLLARATASPLPPGLSLRIEVRLDGLRRRRIVLAWAGGLAAAAALLFAVFLGFPRGPGKAPTLAERAAPIRAAAGETAPPVRVAFTSEVEAVPVKARAPGITIIWLYPNAPERGKDAPAAEGVSDAKPRSGS